MVPSGVNLTTVSSLNSDSSFIYRDFSIVEAVLGHVKKVAAVPTWTAACIKVLENVDDAERLRPGLISKSIKILEFPLSSYSPTFRPKSRIFFRRNRDLFNYVHHCEDYSSFDFSYYCYWEFSRPSKHSRCFIDKDSWYVDLTLVKVNKLL